MSWGTRTTTALMLIALMVACSPSQPSGEPEVEQLAESMPELPPAAESSEPMPAVPTPDTSSGSMVVYACDDGSGLIVTYDEHSALVKLPTGSTALSRAESVSNGGDEAYLGEELSLYRNGNFVQLQIAGKSRACTKTPTS